MAFDPYQILGLEKNADDEAILKAYRERSKATHPDKGGSEDAFHDVKRAHTILTDTKARAHYDRTGEAIDPAVEVWDQHQAWEIIAKQLVARICDTERNVCATNIVTEIVGYINGKLAEADKALAEYARRKGVVNKMLARFSRKSKKGKHNLGVMAMVLANQIESLDRAEEKVRNDRAAFEQAKNLIAEYEFEPERFEQGLAESWIDVKGKGGLASFLR